MPKKNNRQSSRVATASEIDAFAKGGVDTLGAGMNDEGELLVRSGPVFIDFEASSLSKRSWPIEVGLAWIETGQVIVESKLIRPREDWPLDDWSLKSAQIHGIGLEPLEQADSADAVAAWVLQLTGDAVLVSDAPEYDQVWLDRLLGRAGPEVRNFHDVFWLAFSHSGVIAPGRLHKVYKNRASRKSIHRAGSDAADLCYAWRAGLGK
ncbi:hypothetical protein ACFORG_04025 [Lutimaribacter marinistellae]|uniref:DNA polymerase-3 subunit epsilon n=1 Tax=Lutimaribacter marinistellae TaxID=1820329 RepID=A0ABV7TDH9_9RHOB